jgi:hypothetical protein
MCPNCPVPRRFLSVLREAPRSARIWMVLCVVSLTIGVADAQTTNPFPLGGLYPVIVPQRSPLLAVSGPDAMITLTWSAASNSVLRFTEYATRNTHHLSQTCNFQPATCNLQSSPW